MNSPFWHIVESAGALVHANQELAVGIALFLLALALFDVFAGHAIQGQDLRGLIGMLGLLVVFIFFSATAGGNFASPFTWRTGLAGFIGIGIGGVYEFFRYMRAEDKREGKVPRPKGKK